MVELTYPRRLKVGESVAYVGALEVVIISKPFTPGEDAVFAWANSADETTLVDIAPLDDGRDFILLKREHTKQSLEDAVREFQMHYRGLVLSGGR